MSIDTPVPFRGAENKTITFRTVVQPDGDILNFLPSIVLTVDDLASNSKEEFQEASKQHLAKVQAICMNLDGFATIPQGIAAGLGVMISYVTIKSIPTDVNNTVLYITGSICWIIVTYVCNFILRKIVIKRAIELFIKLRSTSFFQSLLKTR
jgi:hypothetical protein